MSEGHWSGVINDLTKGAAKGLLSGCALLNRYLRVYKITSIVERVWARCTISLYAVVVELGPKAMNSGRKSISPRFPSRNGSKWEVNRVMAKHGILMGDRASTRVLVLQLETFPIGDMSEARQKSRANYKDFHCRQMKNNKNDQQIIYYNIWLANMTGVSDVSPLWQFCLKIVPCTQYNLYSRQKSWNKKP